MQVQKITPFLWFDNNAEEAMNFYVSVFKNSKVLNIHHSGKAGPGEDGTVMVVHFELDAICGTQWRSDEYLLRGDLVLGLL
jgi:predicted 3-demethylubiquinone-9 3-methyltransferase (glyoxalase superfamily)